MAPDFILSAPAQAPLATFCTLMMSSVGSDLSTVCGRMVSFGSPTVHVLERHMVPAAYREPCVYTLALLDGAFKGPMRWILKFRDAITLSSLMLLMPDPEIERKRRNREFSAMDTDAYREMCNILCGSAAQGLRDCYGTDLSMSQKETRFIDVTRSRADWDAAFPPSAMVMVEFPLIVSSFPPSVCALVLARDVLEPMLLAQGVAKPFEEIRGTILLVDESDGVHRQLAMTLEGLPYRLHAAATLQLATEGMDVEGVLLILLDVGNSQNDGYAALARIQGNPTLARIPVVMCCAKSILRKEYVVRAIQGGARDFVVKPFERAVLLSKLEKHALAARPGSPGLESSGSQG